MTSVPPLAGNPPPDPAPDLAAGPAHTGPARVGIVIRTRDRPLFVTRALRSVLAQTCGGWRVMLVNDGGNREALMAELVAAGLAGHFAPDADPLQAGTMDLLHHDTSVGRSEAFNRGARALATEFVCCLDDDDTWEPDFLSALLAHHDSTRAHVPDLGGVAALVSALGEDLQLIDGQEVLVPLGEEGLPNAFRRTDFFLNPIAYATYRHDLYPVQWMLNRAAVLAVGGFPPEFSVMEDRAFMTRFLEHWRLAILDRVLAHHHRRIRRTSDQAQSVAMNTLDNPSYDWRRFSDLARMAVNSPDPADPSVSAPMLRALGATLLKEINDETSALWHKINGESAALRERLAALERRFDAGTTPPEAETDPASRLWSLWTAVGPDDLGYRLGVETPFLDRLHLSMPQAQDGLALHASPSRRRLVVQVPATLDWCALEISLGGLARAGEGLRCELVLSGTEEFLFETALSLWTRDRLGRRTHQFQISHVHACPGPGGLRLVRDIPAALLAQGDTPRLSVALPRRAQNFRLICHDLAISRL